MPCLGPGLHARSGSGHRGGRDDTGSALGTLAAPVTQLREELEAPPTGGAVVEMGRDRRQKRSGRGGFGMVVTVLRRNGPQGKMGHMKC